MDGLHGYMAAVLTTGSVLGVADGVLSALSEHGADAYHTMPLFYQRPPFLSAPCTG